MCLPSFWQETSRSANWGSTKKQLTTLAVEALGWSHCNNVSILREALLNVLGGERLVHTGNEDCALVFAGKEGQAVNSGLPGHEPLVVHLGLELLSKVSIDVLKNE